MLKYKTHANLKVSQNRMKINETQNCTQFVVGLLLAHESTNNGLPHTITPEGGRCITLAGYATPENVTF